MSKQTWTSRSEFRTNCCTEPKSKIREQVSYELDQESQSRQFSKAEPPHPPTSYSPRPASGRGAGGKGYSIARRDKQDSKLWNSESSTTDHFTKWFCEGTE